MKAIFFGILLLSIHSFAAGQRTALDSESNIRIYRALKEFGLSIFGTTEPDGGEYLRAARYQRRVQNRIADEVPFPCNVTAGRSETVPTSVDKLRPGDIDVVGALGDSLTAGTGIFATSIFHVVIENRGVSALGGGQSTWREYLTIPNIIKAFNPNLIGYSTRDSFTHQAASQLNVAEIAAMSRDLPYMAQNLVRRMKNHPKVDLQNHWKLINILVGPNDFCSDMCWIETGPWSILKNHRNELLTTLRILKENLPRTLVSVIPPPNLSLLAALRVKSPLCSITTSFECPCLLGLRWETQREEFSEIMSRWQQIDIEIASDPEFQTEDFAVVAQPFLTDLTFPTIEDGTTDWRYLSTDCFHLSQISQAKASIAIWRNMLEPVGRKSRDWTTERIACPTESRPYISTSSNSREASNS